MSENFDADSDGTLSDAEISSVTAINVQGKEITRLNGIEYFTALEDLSFYHNRVTNIDLSKNTALVSLDCRSNYLTRLDVSNSPSLRQLVIDDMYYTLQLLNISNTALTRINNSVLVELRTFIARNCKKLERFVNGYNGDRRTMINTIDLSGCISLTRLQISDNNITSLDLTDCTALQYLYCSSNQLAALDLSNNTSLTSVNCSPQKLPEKPIAFGSGTYPYKFAFSSIMPEALISGVIADSVHGYTSEGSLIDSNFSDGTAEFALLPAEIDYEYSTGSGDIVMLVNVPITASSSSSSSTAPVIMSSTLPNGVSGISYLAELYATGTHPITWTLTSGTLPRRPRTVIIRHSSGHSYADRRIYVHPSSPKLCWLCFCVLLGQDN